MSNKQIVFAYGILWSSLEEQANAQGFTLGDDAEKFEDVREAINLCKFYVATDSQVDMMFRKLQKKVVASLKPLEQEEQNA